jgi:hypothetical protein
MANGLLNQFPERDAAGLDPQFASFGPGGFEQIADHGVQLIHALLDGLQVIDLVGQQGAGQSVHQQRHVLVNAGQRRA